MMRIEIVDLPPGRVGTAAVSLPPADAVVVIDVIRAFTTAAEAFARGAESISCVADTESALELKATGTVDRCMGEDRGLHIDGFEFDNSPRSLPDDLSGVRFAQRTSNGTRGLALVESRFAFAAGATTASAVAAAVLDVVSELDDPSVALLCTDSVRPEDRACAEFIAATLRGRPADSEQLRAAVLAAGEIHVAAMRRRDEARAQSILADVELCADVDRHGFAMRARAVGTSQVLTI